MESVIAASNKKLLEKSTYQGRGCNDYSSYF